MNSALSTHSNEAVSDLLSVVHGGERRKGRSGYQAKQVPVVCKHVLQDRMVVAKKDGRDLTEEVKKNIAICVCYVVALRAFVIDKELNSPCLL